MDCFWLYIYIHKNLRTTWIQVLRRLNSYSWLVGDSRWWESLTMVPAGNKAKYLSSVNHTTRIIHHHHHHHKQFSLVYLVPIPMFSLFSWFLYCRPAPKVRRAWNLIRISVQNGIRFFFLLGKKNYFVEKLYVFL